ncbi:MAG: 4Fe-4S dicluster domain-containing protein [Phycisphaerales bacterium]|nr:MAG: 4Fe-4S dicluster domain-containing protein [Phycisphaerales bacterium]
MLDRVVSQSQLLALVDELALSRRIVGPVRRSDRHFYGPVDRADKLDLDFKYCVYSPKAALFPADQTLFEFQTGPDGFQTSPVYDESPLALVGVHPCDINAIRLLDRVFSNTNIDEHYLSRRRQTFIVGIDCPTPCTSGVFCRDMKANEAREGADIMCSPLPPNGVSDDVRYGVVFGTDAGREFVLYSHAGDPPTVDDERASERYISDKARAFPQSIPYDVDALPELLERSYDSLLWEATARRCYSCGSCNLSCPTCYCFNTYDRLEMTLTSGTRQREWDGCQLRSFAVVAGDHNFRAKAAARLRHRIYRKAKWVKEREGVAGCVGCARCDRACTAKISSVEIYNQLAEEV